MEARCELVLFNLRMPLQGSLVTASLLRSKLPDVKIVGFSALSIADLGIRYLQQLASMRSSPKKMGCRSWWRL